MSNETMLEDIKTGLEHVDATTLQSIWMIIKQSKSDPVAASAITGQTKLPNLAASEAPAKFVGENLTLDEYERLSIKEKGELQFRLKENNHFWLREKFFVLKAAWLAVIDGEIFDWGKSLRNLPLAKQNVEIYHRTGKFPFIFINDDLLSIEESTSVWHATKEY